MDKRNEKNLSDAFANFEVKEIFSSDTIQILDWINKDGSGDFRMKFLIDGGSLFVTGDLGTNAFSWGDRGNNGKLSIPWLAGLSSDYFFEKRTSRDIHENLWSNDFCKESAIASLEEFISEQETSQDLLYQFIESVEYEEFNSQDEWIHWLNSGNGEKYFGVDYSEDMMNAGIVDNYFRHDAIFVALKMIREQLAENKIDQKDIPSVLSDDKKTEDKETPPSP